MARTNPRFNGTVRVGQHRVMAAYLQLAIGLLRSHGTQKQELRRLEEGVIRATPRENNIGMPRGGGVSDPTGAAVARLDDDKEPTFKARAHLRGTIATVKGVVDKLPADQQQILNDLYVRGTKTPVGVAQDMHMSLATVNRKRNSGLLAIAVEIVGEQILMPAKT